MISDRCCADTLYLVFIDGSANSKHKSLQEGYLHLAGQKHWKLPSQQSEHSLHPSHPVPFSAVTSTHLTHSKNLQNECIRFESAHLSAIWVAMETHKPASHGD